MFKQSGTGICWLVGRNFESWARASNAKKEQDIKEEEAGFSQALLEPGSEVLKIGASIKRFKIIV